MRTLSCLLACLLLLACGSGDGDSESDAAASMSEAAAEQTEQPTTLPDAVVALATRNVSCGCVLESVGHCGNYIEIDSRYVEIANSEELGLGPMEWCGKSGVQAESSGEIKDGVFVAATLAVK